MTLRARLRVIDPEAIETPRALANHFTRRVVTPPGAPWRQRRIAELEARLGSPLAAQTNAYRLTRTHPWKLGAPGQFSVVYLHDPGSASFGGGPQDKTTGFDKLTGAFEGTRNRVLLAVAISLVSVLIFGLGVATAVSRRAEVRSELSTLDRSIMRGELRARLSTERQHQATVLRELGAQDRSTERLLADLDWIASHRRADVPILSFHWVDGVSAIEVASDESPFANPDRPVQRASHPVQPGVWLWGVVPPGRIR